MPINVAAPYPTRFCQHLSIADSEFLSKPIHRRTCKTEHLQLPYWQVPCETMDKTQAKSQRLLSLDILRGITIAGMILVNNPGSSPAER